MTQSDSPYDVVIIGGGHAGIEAALAAARMGCRTIMFTLGLDTIGLMPCNPSIGGPAKGQIVGEIDALGGEMGFAADQTFIQMKVLNRSRGPAVQCLRSQNDKTLYNQYMKSKILHQENLEVKQSMINDFIVEDGIMKGVITDLGKSYFSKTVVITTGTFLKGKIHIGMHNHSAGRSGEASAESLSQSLAKLGFKLGRLKTGTPPRLDDRSIDYSKMTLQPGDPQFLHFSFRTTYNERFKNQIPCHLTQTCLATHQIILNNLDRSPMFQKVIKGTGARYCPSIEDKVFRFSDKVSHQIFIEPEGLTTIERYPQGLNTSLPEDVQEAFLRTIPGLENVHILKSGYAVEYDFVFPSQLRATLETKLIKNLFLAGQLNGTSGYEEAAGQGIIAGINAGCRAKGLPEFILKREESFIGTMIDDLITKNVHEPYRMMTSRSEFRLLLRQDNATTRLSEKAHAIGLITQDQINFIRTQRSQVDAYLAHWKSTSISADMADKLNLKQRMPFQELLKRPEFDFKTLLDLGLLLESEKELAERALVEIKYAGYLEKQKKEIEKVTAYENKTIPPTLDFNKILGLKKESREKFQSLRPNTIYEAKKIAGINPADVMILIVYLEKKGLRA